MVLSLFLHFHYWFFSAFHTYWSVIGELQSPVWGAHASLWGPVFPISRANKVPCSPFSCFRLERLLAPFIACLYNKFYVKWFSCSMSSKVPECVLYSRTCIFPYVSESTTIAPKKMRSPSTDKFQMAAAVCPNFTQNLENSFISQICKKPWVKD